MLRISAIFAVLLLASPVSFAKDDSPQDAALAATHQVMEDFMTTFNARDEDAWAATFNYPHVRIASRGVIVSATANDITEGMDFATFAEMTGWHHSGWDKVEPIAVGKDKVHFSVTFSRFRDDGSLLATYESLYIVTLVNGHWGVQARSSFAP